MIITRPRLPGVSSAVVVGVDWGSTTGIAVLVLVTGDVLGTEEIRKPDARKARPAKPATKRRAAIEAEPAVETWETWARHVKVIVGALSVILEPGDVVAIEDPGGHMTRDQWLSHVRVRTACEVAALSNQASFVLVPTNRAKVTAMGHGRAEKEEMILAARKRWPEYPAALTEHTADALWIAETARQGREG